MAVIVVIPSLITLFVKTAHVSFWNMVLKEPTKEHYEEYLADYPKGQFASIAQGELDKMDQARIEFEKADAKDERITWQKYLANYPDAEPFSTRAFMKLRQMDQREWSRTESRNTASAYRNYIKLFPNGENVAEAKARLKGN